MTKEKWLEHMRKIKETGIDPYQILVSGNHNLKGCPLCRDRARTRKRNRNARMTSAAYRSLGMVKVRGNLGGTYWE